MTDPIPQVHICKAGWVSVDGREMVVVCPMTVTRNGMWYREDAEAVAHALRSHATLRAALEKIADLVGDPRSLAFTQQHIARDALRAITAPSQEEEEEGT